MHKKGPGKSERKRQEKEKRVRKARPEDAEEVAAAVLFLACGASAFTTGTALVVDGGFLVL